MRTSRPPVPTALETTLAVGLAAALRALLAGLVIAALPLSTFAETPGARPGDEQMTCEMIAQELAPSALALSGTMAPEAGRISQFANKRSNEGKTELAARSAAGLACVAGAIATSGVADPCVAVNAAFDAAAAASAPRRAAEDRAMTGDMNTMMANMNRSMAGMDQARIKRLMGLAEAKQCRKP